MQPASLRTIDIKLIDDLFGMGGGYVLDFNDKTFAAFMFEELGVDIDHSKYRAEGTSKAKRLRFFLKSSNADLQVRALTALWEYREAVRKRAREEQAANAVEDFNALIARLTGKKPPAPPKPVTVEAAPAVDTAACSKLKADLLAVSSLEPQPRGYAYERFLKSLFDANGLKGRSSFSLVGEQIDGSFELSAGIYYLLEAKWTAERIGSHDLRSFNAKVEDKTKWSRGLFVSNSGFTDEGLTAFGRGKSIVCMDGLDLYDMLDRAIPFGDVMAKKVRRATESGNPFTRVRDLYP